MKQKLKALYATEIMSALGRAMEQDDEVALEVMARAVCSNGLNDPEVNALYAELDSVQLEIDTIKNNGPIIV